MKTGRGKQMNQAGTRSWGSMEPTPKRFNGGQFPVTPQVPTIQRWQPPPPPNFPPPPPHPSIDWQPPHPASQTQQYSQGYQQQQQYNSYAGVINQQAMRALTGNSALTGIGYNQHQRWGQNATSAYQQQNYAYQQQNYAQHQNHGFTANFNQSNQLQNVFAFNQQGQQRQAQQQVESNFNQPSQRQNGFAFNQQGQQRLAQQQQAQSNVSFNRQGTQQQQQHQQQPQRQQQPQTGGRANLIDLRAQLLSTLQNQRKGN